ncbi:MAG: segregation/condensation protein A [Desulfuromonas sp.]|nr:MAG: segregation/condensation protein A [Desulfuromonas sp.]
MGYDIKLEQFEGPLDLLLHLIKKNEMDIWDIQISQITEQYLATLDAMKNLNLDVAGEFLVMAATLLQIKSRLLLPPSEEEEETEDEEEDPRAELVRRLLEYKKYKEAAENLAARPLLGRDQFARGGNDPEFERVEDAGFEVVGLFDLVEAFKLVLAECADDAVHEVDMERLSITDRINTILTTLQERGGVTFRDMFAEKPDRHEVVVTFLAMLELVKMRLVQLMQNRQYEAIWLYPREDSGPEDQPMEEDRFGYQ